MKSLLDELRPTIRDLAVFSFCVNLLFVVPALYTLQVFDRVLPSNSYEAVPMLGLCSSQSLMGHSRILHAPISSGGRCA